MTTVRVNADDLREVLLAAEYINDARLRGPVDRLGDALLIATRAEEEASTVETDDRFAAMIYPADDTVAEYVIASGRTNGKFFDTDSCEVEQWDGGTSEWKWVRFADGDLMLGCFPQADLYEMVELAVDQDYTKAENNGTLVSFEVGPEEER